MCLLVFIASIMVACIDGSETDLTLTTEDSIATTIYALTQSIITNETVDSNGGGVDVSKMTLEEVCQLLGILAESCSCSNPNMTDVCGFINKGKEVSVTFSCDNVSNKAIGIANLISSALALVGNGFVIGFGFIGWRELSRFRQLITGLAMSDFVFAIVQTIISIPETWTCHWLYGLFLCKVLRALLAASANIAVGFIVIVAIDRYIGIVHLFSKALNQTRLGIAVSINVVAGLLSVVPPLVVLKLGEFTTCAEEWSKVNSTVYTWVLFFIYYLIPIAVLVVLYTIMIIWLRKAYIKSNVLNDEQQRLRLAKNKKTLIMLISILVMFAILVLPNRVVWIINDLYGLGNIKDKNVIRFLRMISEIPYGFHAAVNPIIYSVVDVKFRSQLKNLLCLLKRRSSLEVPSSRSMSESTIQMNIVNTSESP